jgi:hypothetical protein
MNPKRGERGQVVTVAGLTGLCYEANVTLMLCLLFSYLHHTYIPVLGTHTKD